MLADDIFRITKSDGAEFRDISANNDKLWERAMPVTTAKAESVAFRPTRKTGGDGVTYPAFSPQTVLPSAKTFGNHSKHKAPKLWGQYVPCEYIKNGASTLIKTGIISDNTKTFEFYLRVKCATTGSWYMFQARNKGEATWGISGSSTGSTITFNGLRSDIKRTTGHIYEIRGITSPTGRSLYVKDITTGTEATQTSENPTTYFDGTEIGLFGNVADGDKLASGHEVYRAYIKIDEEMAWDMYPCVDVTNSNAPVAYDNVTHTGFVPSAGSITGGELIQPISYAESDGTAWVDTGVVPDDTVGFELKLSITDITSDTYRFGDRVGTNGRFNIGSVNRKYYPAWDSITSPPSNIPTISANVPNVISLNINNDRAFRQDGVAYWQNLPTLTTVHTDTAIAFGRRYDGTVSSNAQTIYYLKMTDGNTFIRDYQPVRVGQNVELLDLVSWTFATRTGTFTAGADIPYTFMCPDIIKVNTGDLAYEDGSIHTDGTHKLYLKDADDSVIATRDIPMLLSEDSVINVQTGAVSEAWAAIWYDGTQTVPSGYISQTGDLTPNQIVLYPLTTPAQSTVSIAPFELTQKAQYTLTATAELPVKVQAEYLGAG